MQQTSPENGGKKESKGREKKENEVSSPGKCFNKQKELNENNIL